MKKILTILIFTTSICLSFSTTVLALGKLEQLEINKIENELYGFEYINDNYSERISRLEKYIYGKVSSGDIKQRLKRIAIDINAEQIGKQITPSEDTFEEVENIADNTVNYPVVDEIEMKIFNKTYKNRDFHTRIVTIERKLFGKIYDVEDYSTRMDRIKAEVVPERLAREKVFGYDNSDEINSIDLSGLNNSRFSTKMPYGQENYTRPYVNYGDDINNAMYYDNNLDDELAEMEQNTFGTVFSNEDTQSRVRRLNSVQKAKQSSSKYDTNKFQQRMSTAMEIGAMLLMILAMVL